MSGHLPDKFLLQGPFSASGMVDRRLLQVGFGPLPVSLIVQQTIKRAELWAVLTALRHGMAPLTIITDHLPILDAIRRGRPWCVAAGRVHADVWVLV